MEQRVQKALADLRDGVSRPPMQNWDRGSWRVEGRCLQGWPAGLTGLGYPDGQHTSMDSWVRTRVWEAGSIFLSWSLWARDRGHTLSRSWMSPTLGEGASGGGTQGALPGKHLRECLAIQQGQETAS